MMRYTADFVPAANNDVYAIRDNFTNKTVYDSLSEQDAYERTDRMNTEWSRVEALAENVSRTVLNGMDERPKRDFVTAMSREHRTLQQEFTKLCVQWLEHLAALKPDQYDLRNVYSVRLAQALQKTEAWQEYKYLPTI